MNVRIGPTEDLETCRLLRQTVFVEEQNVPVDIEQDGRDAEAHHILAVVDKKPVGCARILIKRDTGKIGRVCVLSKHRGTGLGKGLVQASIDLLRTLPGVQRAELGAQTHTLGFYEKFGFIAFGPEFVDGGMPHRMMARSL